MQLQSPVFILFMFLLGLLMFEPNPAFVIVTLQFAYRNIQSKLERLPHYWLKYCTDNSQHGFQA